MSYELIDIKHVNCTDENCVEGYVELASTSEKIECPQCRRLNQRKVANKISKELWPDSNPKHETVEQWEEEKRDLQEQIGYLKGDVINCKGKADYYKKVIDKIADVSLMCSSFNHHGKPHNIEGE